ncbi:dipeptide ABC transporter ATP-binding protein [Corynebacterium spheniscorum]|uniref:Peptide/nickel transport system ATP-binding protein n=1 Tax=Corynebacterium spheniscorum TaxID=185761 RepID=A0A1I2QMJ2_9CORY|nr:ABC transporter ATP-binding protein [Corynebacterium spheniscorum]KAA8719380.1 ABC transporter ATP-binding protein [Corynebacterium spheniscorum]SFG28539.1 peptide/nickel transport system ATP-binding protein [Corynebacterium spheniscorum]
MSTPSPGQQSQLDRQSAPLALEVRDLRITDTKKAKKSHGRNRGRDHQRDPQAAELLHGINFVIPKGGRLGLIGESGSGKSLTALGIMGLLPEGLEASGQITIGDTQLDGSEVSATSLLGARTKVFEKLRGRKVAMIFQEPMTALNPLMRVGRQVAEIMEVHGRPHQEATTRTRELFEDVGLGEEKLRSYPHELSGGQRQRVLIAMALANDPDVLICDEPTTALDVTVQKQILDLISALVARTDTALLFITHDLGVVAQMCEQVVVLHRGTQVEEGSVEEVLRNPQKEYTKKLVLASQPGAPAQLPANLSDKDATPSLAVNAQGLSRIYRRRRTLDFLALDSVDLHVPAGGRCGIVGGSGSGKSTLLKILGGLDKPDEGQVELFGTPLSEFSRKDLSQTVQLVFQDPASSLDPRMPIGLSIAEPLRGRGLSKQQRMARVAEVLSDVGLDPEMATRLPHEFSGGQRQRISIARALSVRPKILLADEPVSALDVSVRAQVLALLDCMAADYGLTLLFVSHDLAVVRELCTHVAVVNHGRIVEHGLTENIWRNPQDPYTQALLAAIPRVEQRV